MVYLSSLLSQFHYGSIQIFPHTLFYTHTHMSQFHYGSIQIGKIAIKQGHSAIVSIPLWFDSNVTGMNAKFREVRSQFHYGSIQIHSVHFHGKLESLSQFHYGSIQMVDSR